MCKGCPDTVQQGSPLRVAPPTQVYSDHADTYYRPPPGIHLPRPRKNPQHPVDQLRRQRSPPRRLRRPPTPNTPNLDALGARGMIYRTAWSTAPVCAPARTTIISGMYPPSTGSQHMRSSTRLPQPMKMFPPVPAGGRLLTPRTTPRRTTTWSNRARSGTSPAGRRTGESARPANPSSRSSI